jgi:hypothetical protein
MVILILEMVMLAAGVVALVRGEIPLTKAYFVDGWPARIAGAVLLLPAPVAFLIGFIVRLVQGVPADPSALVLYVDVPLMAVCGFLAAGICLGSAAAETWRGRTYLSDTEGSLGSWNAAYAPTADRASTGRPSARPRKKQPRVRQASAGSGTAIMAGVIAAFLGVGVLISGGVMWLANRSTQEPEPVGKNTAATPEHRPVPPVLVGPHRGRAPVRRATGAASPTGAAPPVAEKPAGRKAPQTGKRAPRTGTEPKPARGE